ncbi:MAG: peptidoglycan bridge formation glycyltransferase FemA/FemB family protein [Candidatus Saccharimonadales bacterium]
MISVNVSNDREEWDEYVLAHKGHPLQLWSWGEVKAAHNWQVARAFVADNGEIIGAAQILIRHLPGPFRSLAYIPRGPVTSLEKREAVLDEIASYVKDTFKSVALSVEPDDEATFDISGWQQTDNTILIPRTIILDLDQSVDSLMDSMSKKTRQYIRKSGGEEMTIRRVKTKEDLELCLEIYRLTSKRAHFALHDDEYYEDIFHMMGDYSPVFAAFVDDRPVAFLWLAISRHTAFELYGGVSDEGQQLRANYALKWYAITKMREWGISRYDLNGLLNDGISTFKQGFAGHENQLAGTYDKPLSPLYIVWQRGLPAMKHVVRKVKSLRK